MFSSTCSGCIALTITLSFKPSTASIISLTSLVNFSKLVAEFDTNVGRTRYDLGPTFSSVSFCESVGAYLRSDRFKKTNSNAESACCTSDEANVDKFLLYWQSFSVIHSMMVSIGLATTTSSSSSTFRVSEFHVSKANTHHPIRTMAIVNLLDQRHCTISNHHLHSLRAYALRQTLQKWILASSHHNLSYRSFCLDQRALSYLA